jgi:hypothetical protein
MYIRANRRYVWPMHGVYDTFSGLIREALFMICPEDLEKEEKSLTERLLKDSTSKVLYYWHGHIPNPIILLPLTQKAVELCTDVKDAKFGDVFFCKATWKVHVNLVQHIKLGCESDMPGVDCYYYLTTKSGNKKLMCIHGTPQLEGCHAHLRCIIPGFHTSPCLVTCMLALFVFCCNIDRSVERGISDKIYGSWYNHDVILQLQHWLQWTPYAEQFEDDTNYKDLAET